MEFLMSDMLEGVEFDDESDEEQAQIEPLDRADTIESSLNQEIGRTAELDDATLEPAAQIEAAGDYAQSEAIEAAMTELVDESQQEAAEGGKRDFDQKTDGPSQHYSGVQMTQGEVQSDQDWNEGANAPPTEEAGGRETNYSPSAGADHVPLEEMDTAASQVIARAFLDSGFRSRLMEHPDEVLEEHGLTREDLPDLNDPQAPEAAAFIRQVHGRIIDGIDESSRSEAENIFESQESMDEERMLALQMAMDKKDQSEKTTTTVMKTFQNTARDLVANLK
jgi:hypothetical protein